MVIKSNQSNHIGRLRAHFGDFPEQLLPLMPPYHCEQHLFEIERQRIVFKTWQFLCYGEELRDAGSI